VFAVNVAFLHAAHQAQWGSVSTRRVKQKLLTFSLCHVFKSQFNIGVETVCCAALIANLGSFDEALLKSYITNDCLDVSLLSSAFVHCCSSVLELFE